MPGAFSRPSSRIPPKSPTPNLMTANNRPGSSADEPFFTQFLPEDVCEDLPTNRYVTMKTPAEYFSKGQPAKLLNQPPMVVANDMVGLGRVTSISNIRKENSMSPIDHDVLEMLKVEGIEVPKTEPRTSRTNRFAPATSTTEPHPLLKPQNYFHTVTSTARKPRFVEQTILSATPANQSTVSTQAIRPQVSINTTSTATSRSDTSTHSTSHSPTYDPSTAAPFSSQFDDSSDEEDCTWGQRGFGFKDDPEPPKQSVPNGVYRHFPMQNQNQRRFLTEGREFVPKGQEVPRKAPSNPMPESRERRELASSLLDDPQNDNPKFRNRVPKKMTEEELLDDIEEGPAFEELRQAPIEIQGGGNLDQGEIIQLIETFEECGFSDQMVINIIDKKYSDALPVQKAMITLMLQRENDIVAHAQTGAGKTASYLLPIIHQIQQTKNEKGEGKNTHNPYAIILLPTRVLVNEVYKTGLILARDTNVKLARCMGDYPRRELIYEIRSGCDIMICTVGRLKEFVETKIVFIKNVRHFVLDEADKMIKETEDFYGAVKEFKEKVHPDHRTFLFSATFDHQAQRTADAFLKPDYYIVRVGSVNQSVKTVKQEFWEVDNDLRQKAKILAEFLKSLDESYPCEEDGKVFYRVPKTLVFLNQKKRSEKLAVHFGIIQKIRSHCIHGGRRYFQRNEALAMFQEDDVDVLFATDVIGRGVNLKGLKYVINLDIPKCIDEYIHRIGRTGRKGNEGIAISFFSRNGEHDLNMAPGLVKMLEDLDQPVPEFLRNIVEDVEANIENMRLLMGSYDQFSS